MDGFVGNVARTQSVNLSVEWSDFDWTHEGKVFTHEVVEVSKGYVRFFHLGLKTALEYPLTFGPLQDVNFQQYL